MGEPQLIDPFVHLCARPLFTDDDRRVLTDDDLSGMTKVGHGHQAELVAHPLAYEPTADARGDVTHQLVLLVAELRWRDGAQLQPVLNDVGGQRRCHLVTARSDDEQLMPTSHDGLEHRLNL